MAENVNGKYQQFLERKHLRTEEVGFESDESELNPIMFPFQKACASWALKVGRAALFEGCGLGKTFQQLEWSNHVARHTGGNVLIVAPLAVSVQTIGEGLKMGLEVHQCRSMADVKDGINICNYEMVHHFDASKFAGVVLDESSILKAFMGKTRSFLIDMFSRTPYRLCCTATPAPNDFTELGNHAEFLGVARYHEMLSRWFINDGFNAQGWRLKKHAEESFWQWVSTWAVCMSKPSDIGFDDNGFILPPLVTEQHVIEEDMTDFSNGRLIRKTNLSAIELRREMKRTVNERAEKTASLVSEIDDSVLIWTNTNAEADELKKRTDGAYEVRGSMKPEQKEEYLNGFSKGDIRILITKPSIAGFGMNWQHCNQMFSVGLSYSFEERYQAIRRCWRFGQKRTVFDNVVMSPSERCVFASVAAKEKKHVEMETQSASHINSIAKLKTGNKFRNYSAEKAIKLPSFLEVANAM